MCEMPMNIPNRRATAAEVEKWWSIDRLNLRKCADKHGLMVIFYKTRDGIKVEAHERQLSKQERAARQ